MSESRYTGKQVLGFVIAALVVLGLGLTVGGVVGYRWGKAAGVQQISVSAPAPAPNRPGNQTPRQNAVPDNAPYLGVEFEMITPQIAARENITGTAGAIIRSVIADSPAEQAGLMRGDIVTDVGGTLIDAQHTLRDQVAAHAIGDVITLTVVTAANPTQAREVKVTLAPRPADNDLQMPGNFPGVPSPNNPSG